MKSCFIRCLLALLASVALNSTVLAAGSVDSLLSGVKKIVDTFTSLQTKIESLGDIEVRRRIIEKMGELHEDIYDLEKKKRYFIETSTGSRMTRNEIDKATADLKQSIEKTRTHFRDVALVLRDQFDYGGEQVDGDLSLALGKRKSWIGDLQEAFDSNDSARLKAVLSEGEKAADGLKSANAQLGKLIHALKHTP